MNNALKNYLTTFEVRFADHVSSTYTEERLAPDKIDFGNILLIDDGAYNYETTTNEDDEEVIIAIKELDDQLNQGLSFNETKSYLATILDYRLQAQSILDYLQDTMGNDLTTIYPKDLKRILPKEYKNLIEEFDNHKMQARTLTSKDFN